MSIEVKETLRYMVESHLRFIYSDEDISALATRLLHIMELDENIDKQGECQSAWSERDIIAITYGDSIREPDSAPLATLDKFLRSQLADVISGVHILPFFPYSSDDGFSVIDYTQVNDGLGGWEHIESIAKDFDLMADLVINHCSSRSRWFDNFKQLKDPGKEFFITVPPDTNVSEVVRPRTSPLLRETETLEGKKYVWATFSHDQVDLNFANIDVLCEMVKIIKLYLDRGTKIFRLDAVAFLWKELGTPCINHPKTHEVVRLLRTLIEFRASDSVIITETNLPNLENLSYFGNANEAHAIYNFSLPPLVLDAMVRGNSQYLKQWQMSMPPAQLGTFYLNFLASHDGIGLRPAEGILPEEEIDVLANTMQSFGARISWRAVEGGRNKPYEINITWFDAMQGTTSGPDKWQLERFICSHAIMVALEGIPAIYIHSFVGTKNYYEGVEFSNQNRAINRYRWDYDDLLQRLSSEDDAHAKIFERMKHLLELRIHQPAFNPNATQFTLHLGDEIFGFWRQSIERDQSIFCINNITDETIEIPLSSINLIIMDKWTDLVSGTEFDVLHEKLVLHPYQFVWLTNKVYS